MKIRRLMPIAAGAVIAGIYSFATGKGVFNKVRFKNEREAVKAYISSRKVYADFSNLKMSGNGYITVLTEENGDRYILYLNKYEGTYIFSEHKMEE